MASQDAITAIKLELPDEAEALGLDDNSIGILIDAGLSTNKVLLAAWRSIAGKAFTFTDVSESGSSRQFGALFDRAKQMIDFYQARSDAEDLQSGVLPAREHGASHTSVRV